MSLSNLVGISIERIAPNQATINKLREAAKRSLNDAQIHELSPENKFDLAYKAIMQLSNLALQTNGYRTLTSKPGHHQTLIQTLPQTLGVEPETMIVLDGLRRQRNIIDYSGDMVSDSMAKEAIRHAVYLTQKVDEWLTKNK